MAFDEQSVARSFAFDPDQVAELRRRWCDLMDMCVWADLKSGKIGAVPRLRKRMLELGEALRSVASDRSWIPHPREQVKGALAASLNLRDALLSLERAARLIDGGRDFAAFEVDLLAFRERLLKFVEKHEMLWGDLLESQYDGPVDEG